MSFLSCTIVACLAIAADPTPLQPAAGSSDTPGGWKKYAGNPVLGGQHGTCFDICVLKEGGTYRMWVSWRPKASIALVESSDGIHWSEPRIVLGPRKESGWEDDVNRPIVLKRGDGYHLWYTGQAKGHSWIGYATSNDGVAWKRMSPKPVLSPEKPWEKVAVMCPHVLWDEQARSFRMWYSGGEQYEPRAIGYATSPDGLTWTKHATNPIFVPDKQNAWEKDRVTACQVIRQGDWHVMFYIGFRDEATAQIGTARSRDGITHWQRHPANPIVRRGKGEWDADACYKPFAVQDGKRWLLWYNGRRGALEQIGLATHEGEDLGFRPDEKKLPPQRQLDHPCPFSALSARINGFRTYPTTVRMIVGWHRAQRRPTIERRFLVGLVELDRTLPRRNERASIYTSLIHAKHSQLLHHRPY